MEYTIIWSDAAERRLRKLDYSVSKTIYRKVGELAKDPFRNAKKLIGEECYRIRVGDYRVIYEVDNGRLFVLVVKVGHRSTIYR